MAVLVTLEDLVQGTPRDAVDSFSERAQWLGGLLIDCRTFSWNHKQHIVQPSC